MGDFAEAHRAEMEAALQPGEELCGIIAVNHQQNAFKGRVVAIGVTPDRLLIQPLSRRGEADGPVEVLTRPDVVGASLTGAGGGWGTLEAAVADHMAVKVVLRTAGGTKWKLFMMHGEGILGGLGGGEPQRQGVRALAEWLEQVP